MLISRIKEDGREKDRKKHFILDQDKITIIGNKESEIYPKESIIPPSRSSLFTNRIDIPSRWITRNHCAIHVKESLPIFISIIYLQG